MIERLWELAKTGEGQLVVLRIAKDALEDYGDEVPSDIVENFIDLAMHVHAKNLALEQLLKDRGDYTQNDLIAAMEKVRKEGAKKLPS